MPTTYNDPIMLDSTGQDIVTKLDSIASLMGDGVIDDTSTTATDKTWSASKENTTVNGLQDNVIANTKLIKDTVGWSGKNKLIYPYAGTTFTANGVTYNVQSDGSIKITASDVTGATSFTVQSRTASPIYLPIGKYKISLGCNNDKISFDCRTTYNGNSKALSAVATGSNEIEFEITADTQSDYKLADGSVLCGVFVGTSLTSGTYNDTVYPMIRDASILDDTYEPYFGSTAFPRSEQGVLGAKNINCTKYNNFTAYGVTWLVNSNNSVTLNGSSTEANTDNGTNVSQGFTAPFTKVVKCLGGVDANLTVFPYDWTINARPFTDATKTQRVSDQFGEPIPFYMEAGHIYTLIIRAKRNRELNNITVFPQILLETDSDLTYSVPAMTNRELTEIKTGTIDLSHTESTTTPSAHADRTNLERIGRTCIFNFWINFVTVSETNTWKELLRVDLKPTKPALVVCRIGDGNTCTGMLDTNGVLNIYPNNAISNNSVGGQVAYFI